MKQSYAHGAHASPLIGESIGAMFDRVALAAADRDALVSVQQGVRLSYRELRAIVWIGEDPVEPPVGGSMPWGQVLDGASSVSEAALAERLALTQFDEAINTSGTTGFPKGATLSHHNILNIRSLRPHAASCSVSRGLLGDSIVLGSLPSATAARLAKGPFWAR